MGLVNSRINALKDGRERAAESSSRNYLLALSVRNKLVPALRFGSELLKPRRRYEALECENVALRFAVYELQRSIADVRSSFAARDKERERAIAWLREQNRTLRTVQVDLRERLSASVSAAANVAETLVRQNQCEIAVTRQQIAEADARLAEIHRSAFWKMKLRIVSMRARLRSLVHAAGG